MSNHTLTLKNEPWRKSHSQPLFVNFITKGTGDTYLVYLRAGVSARTTPFATQIFKNSSNTSGKCPKNWPVTCSVSFMVCSCPNTHAQFCSLASQRGPRAPAATAAWDGGACEAASRPGSARRSTRPKAGAAQAPWRAAAGQLTPAGRAASRHIQDQPHTHYAV